MRSRNVSIRKIKYHNIFNALNINFIKLKSCIIPLHVFFLSIRLKWHGYSFSLFLYILIIFVIVCMVNFDFKNICLIEKCIYIYMYQLSTLCQLNARFTVYIQYMLFWEKKIFEIHVLRTLYIKYNALHYICLKEIT